MFLSLATQFSSQRIDQYTKLAILGNIMCNNSQEHIIVAWHPCIKGNTDFPFNICLEDWLDCKSECRGMADIYKSWTCALWLQLYCPSSWSTFWLHCNMVSWGLARDDVYMLAGYEIWGCQLCKKADPLQWSTFPKGLQTYLDPNCPSKHQFHG